MSVSLHSKHHRDPVQQHQEKPKPPKDKPVSRPQDRLMKPTGGNNFTVGSSPVAPAKPQSVPTVTPAQAQKLVAAALQTVNAQGSPHPFDPRVDVNGDGTINILDITRIATQYNQTGPNLAGDVDGSGRVDIIDLAQAAVTFNQSANTDMGDPMHPVFSPLNEFMTVFEDSLRGTVVQLAGFIGFNPVDWDPAVTDSYFVIKDGFGDPVLKGRVEKTGKQWSIIVLERDMPDSLLRSTHFEVSVYLKGSDGHWAMNHQDFPLQGNSLQQFIEGLKKF